MSRIAWLSAIGALEARYARARAVHVVASRAVFAGADLLAFVAVRAVWTLFRAVDVRVARRTITVTRDVMTVAVIEAGTHLVAVLSIRIQRTF